MAALLWGGMGDELSSQCLSCIHTGQKLDALMMLGSRYNGDYEVRCVSVMSFSSIDDFEYVFGNWMTSFQISYRIAWDLVSWQRYV